MNAAPRMTLHEMRALVCAMSGTTTQDEQLINDLTRTITTEIDKKPQVFDFGRLKEVPVDQGLAGELWHHKLLRLPFPVCVFTFVPHHARITLIAFDDVEIHVAGETRATDCTGVVILSQPGDGVKRVDAFSWFTLPELGKINTGATALSNCDDETDESFQSYTMSCVARVLTLSLLLNTKGLRKRHEPVPVKLNQKRARSGKPPLDAVTYINLDGVSNSAGSSNDREMPMHFRRGHIRHYNDGSLTWVRDTIVKADGQLKERARYQIR